MHTVYVRIEHTHTYITPVRFSFFFSFFLSFYFENKYKDFIPQKMYCRFNRERVGFLFAFEIIALVISGIDAQSFFPLRG